MTILVVLTIVPLSSEKWQLISCPGSCSYINLYCQVLWSWFHVSVAWRDCFHSASLVEWYRRSRSHRRIPSLVRDIRFQIHRVLLICSRQSETRTRLACGPCYGVCTSTKTYNEYSRTSRHSEFRPDHGAFYGEKQSPATIADRLGAWEVPGILGVDMFASTILSQRSTPRESASVIVRHAWTRSQWKVGARLELSQLPWREIVQAPLRRDRT